MLEWNDLKGEKKRWFYEQGSKETTKLVRMWSAAFSSGEGERETEVPGSSPFRTTDGICSTRTEEKGGRKRSRPGRELPSGRCEERGGEKIGLAGKKHIFPDQEIAEYSR